MQHESIEFRGTYLYADPAALERAMAAAREQAASDDDLDLEWLRSFVSHGARLYVRAQLPISADRFAAANVVETLARDAVEGVVEARRGDVALDFFPSGED
jgi:hypothetical protein